MMNSAIFRYLAAAGAVTALATACSTGSGPVTRSGTPGTASSAVPSAPATSATSATSPAAPSGTASPAGQRVTVTPDTGLAATQTVLVQADGFSPGEPLVVTECADKGTATGPGDCDLAGLQSVTADSAGRVRIQFTVRKGPFGANNITCGPAQACLVSVNQASPSPTEQAGAAIKFS